MAVKLVLLGIGVCLVLSHLGAVQGAERRGPAAAPAVPGVVVAHSPASSRKYIGCPGLVILPDGSYVASHSHFGPGSTGDRMFVYRSSDKGRSWQRLTEVKGQWWSSLFLHRGGLWLMGVSRRYGHVVIRRSADGGRTWTTPADARTGLLLAGGQYHTAPVPVAVHNGRIWRAMEDRNPPTGWASTFRAFVMSAPADADLLDAKCWTASNRLRFRREWLARGTRPGWLEGNVVAAPTGRLVNVLRVNAEPGYRKAAIVDVSADGRKVSFDPAAGLIDFYGGMSKFTIRHDAATKRYWTLGSLVTHPKNPRQRNTLALTSSANLRDWRVESVVLRHDEGGVSWRASKVGFQYVDWQFEGEDIVFVSRTAFAGAHNYHDANYLTFHRLRDFRKLSRSP